MLVVQAHNALPIPGLKIRLGSAPCFKRYTTTFKKNKDKQHFVYTLIFTSSWPLTIASDRGECPLDMWFTDDPYSTNNCTHASTNSVV